MCSCQKEKNQPVARKERENKQTNLDGRPPGEEEAPRRVLESNAPAERNEALHLHRLYAPSQIAYQLMRLRRRPRIGVDRPVVRLVEAHFGYGHLERTPRISRKGHVGLEDGRAC